MKDYYLEPTQEAGARLFSRKLEGELVMLNLLRLKDIADYYDHPALAPDAPISGREAFQKYTDHTLPFLKASGGELLFLGSGGQYFIGPQDEQWDLVMLVKQQSLNDFLAFNSNPEYMAGIGHRAAAIMNSRLLPIEQSSTHT